MSVQCVVTNVLEIVQQPPLDLSPSVNARRITVFVQK